MRICLSGMQLPAMFPTLSPKSSCKVCLQQYWEGVHRDYDHSPLSYIHLRCGSISRAGFEHHHGGSEARNPLQAWGTTIYTNSDHKTSFHCRNVFQTLLGAQELQHSIDITRYALHYACINAFKTQKHNDYCRVKHLTLLGYHRLHAVQLVLRSKY